MHRHIPSAYSTWSDPEQCDYQAVQEVLSTIDRSGRAFKYEDRVLEGSLVGRTILFRVPWIDDQAGSGKSRYRVDSTAPSDVRGGLRFHPSVNLGILNPGL
ncbi:MAG: hypothetical protein ACLSUW_07020 [Akkermansia sp.]